MKFDKNYAIVTNTDDPEKRGRIKVKSDNFLSENIEIPYWIEPRFHYVTKNGGFFAVPEIDSMVEIEFPISSGDDELPDLSSLTPTEVRYICTAFNDIQSLSKIFETNYPRRIGWAFPESWAIYVDTKDGSIFLGHLSGTTPKSWILIEKDKITIETDQGVRIKLEPNNTLVIETDGGDKISMEASQLLIESSTPINLKSPNVNIGGTSATDFLVKGTTLIPALTAFYTGWQGAINTWVAIPPLDPGAIAYLNTLLPLVAAILAVLPTSLSVNHKVQ